MHCGPAHIHQIEAGSGIEGVRPLVPAYVHLPVLLAGPGPSGSTDPSRRCRGCLPPSPAFPGPGCPQLQRAAATAQRRSPFTPSRSKRRLVAHHRFPILPSRFHHDLFHATRSKPIRQLFQPRRERRNTSSSEHRPDPDGPGVRAQPTTSSFPISRPAQRSLITNTMKPPNS